MRLATFRIRGRESDGDRLGLAGEDEAIRDVTERAGTSDLVTLIEHWGDVSARIGTVLEDAPRFTPSELTLRPPVARPRRNLFCVGKNYHEHAREFGRSGYDAGSDTTSNEQTPERPVVFTKPPSTLIAHGDLIDPHASLTRELDYEAELAVIIGRRGRGIRREEALSHVFGYSIVNDVTARDLQRDHKQWFLGKGLDTFCPMGPFVVTRDEAGDGPFLLECRVNGELRQKASTRDLVFDVPSLIATISAGITLAPGDVIATGTPAGVGIGFRPPRFLRSGDTIEISIGGLGALVNRVG